MSPFLSLRSLALACLILLAGCGSSEDERTEQALKIYTSGAAWVAYQDGDGAWQPLSLEDSASVVLESTSLYPLHEVRRPSAIHQRFSARDLNRYKLFSRRLRFVTRRGATVSPMSASTLRTKA